MHMEEKNARLRQAILAAASQEDNSGIGRLGEKRLHAILKYYFEPNAACHEVNIAGYYADIANADGITEIQTAGFGSMRRKLEAFLPSWPVNVVYPAAAVRTLHWLNQATGEVCPGRKTRQKGALYSVAKELVFIKPLLLNPNLSFTVVLLEVDEYKLLNGRGPGKKLGAAKHDKMPKAILGEEALGGQAGYSALLPPGLPATFSTRDYRQYSGLGPRFSQMALNVLKNVGCVQAVGKQGNLLLYRRAETGAD